MAAFSSHQVYYSPTLHTNNAVAPVYYPVIAEQAVGVNDFAVNGQFLFLGGERSREG